MRRLNPARDPLSCRVDPARDPLSCRLSPARLPATGMNHNLAAAWFALRCLGYSLVHPHRRVRP